MGPDNKGKMLLRRSDAPFETVLLRKVPFTFSELFLIGFPSRSTYVWGFTRDSISCKFCLIGKGLQRVVLRSLASGNSKLLDVSVKPRCGQIHRLITAFAALGYLGMYNVCGPLYYLPM